MGVMKRLPALLVLAAACGLAHSEPCLDLTSAMALLGSDSPDDRERGERAIGDLARTQQDAVRAQLNDEDPEIRARIRRALRENHLLTAAEIESEAQAILEGFAKDPAEDPDARERLVENLLALGAPALKLLQREFENTDVEPIRSPPRLVNASTAGTFSTYVRNKGPVGAWFDTASSSWSSIGWIGEDWRPRAEAPEDLDMPYEWRRGPARPATLREWLRRAHRVPPGAVAEWDSIEEGFKIDYGCRLSASRGGRDLTLVPAPEVIDGVTLQVRRTPLPRTPHAAILQLREIDSHAFGAVIVRDVNRWGLRLTALESAGPTRHSNIRKREWFVAIDARDGLLEFGPLCEQGSSGIGWAVGETRTTWLDRGLPRGTATLWMGFDYGDAQGEQAVAKPLKIPLARIEDGIEAD
ncbi:MAG: hypothetical protein FD180_1117 [Planctomycetota bacterium]|nr:MAG: hypothetical protein FD180_1117 [Planctomycetota bacterium]